MNNRLSRFSSMHDYRIRRKDPDVRNWKVRGKNRLIGHITEMIVDVRKKKVVFLEVFRQDLLGKDDSEAYILLPIDKVELNRETKEAIAANLTDQMIEMYPVYENRIIGPDYLFKLENYYELIKDEVRMRNIKYSSYQYKDTMEGTEWREAELRIKYLECQKQLRTALAEKDLAVLERDIALAQLRKDRLSTEVVINREARI